MGRPTMLERPTMTQCFPLGSLPDRCSISTIPAGVQGARTSVAPVARRPTLVGQGKLDQDPVDVRIRVQTLYDPQELVFRDIGIQVDLPGEDPHLLGRLVLHSHVTLTGRILPYQDRGQPWCEVVFFLEFGHPLSGLAPDSLRDLFA